MLKTLIFAALAAFVLIAAPAASFAQAPGTTEAQMNYSGDFQLQGR